VAENSFLQHCSFLDLIWLMLILLKLHLASNKSTGSLGIDLSNELGLVLEAAHCKVSFHHISEGKNSKVISLKVMLFRVAPLTKN
jgi:hypothetical protein